ncbi:hypothetical protein, partial [Pseudomonas sp. TJI-51]|uniref:hypothetical protein n=1 Tax=Pseudomonas sp. (strain TJI-51) TaxID=985010 RepID=UPI001C438A3C
VQAGQQRDPFSPQGFEIEHQCSQSRVVINPTARRHCGKVGRTLESAPSIFCEKVGNNLVMARLFPVNAVFFSCRSACSP